MAKLRIESRYGVIPNSLLNSSELTLKAKGLFAFIQSKPDGWSFSAKKIALQCKESHVAILSGLRELEEQKLLTRNRFRKKNGTWGHEYVLTDKPWSRNLTTDNPTTVNPTVENIGHISKQDKVNKNSNKEKEIPPNPPKGGKGRASELVEKFFELKEWKYDKSKAPVFRRHLKPAKDLLELCDNDIEKSVHKLRQIAYWADAKELDWSIDTVLKKWFELDKLAQQVEKTKKAYIGNDRAYKDKRGQWHVILPSGEHKKYIGSPDTLYYANT